LVSLNYRYLHLGIIAPIKRKSLPEICKVVALKYAHSWHHFITKSPGSSTEMEAKRFTKILKELKGKAITLVIDEREYRKKGKKTDYVARKYLGSVGKLDKGIVSFNAYGIYKNISFPLNF
jgi:SRSO17 transposase